ncbi:MAG: hypothetical protein AB9866_05685 [Syntrophobacteraceae bacterium]
MKTMKPARLHRNEKGALEILEEAAHLLRFAPAGAFLCYYLGTLPFVLGLLFFWADMSCSGDAGTHLVQASLALTILFLWMKCWQAVFSSSLHAFLQDVSRDPWSPRRVVRLVCIQSAVMPWAFILMPLALIITLPFGWCYAFFQNVTATGSGKQGLKKSVEKAWHQSTLWPAQNHKLILIMVLFGLFVFLNIGAALYLIPIMLRIFLGMETVFSKTDMFFLNSTFILSVAGITYLCMNPLIRAAYVVRCYYGDSLYSGRDLLAELRRVNSFARQALVLMITAAAFQFLLPACTIATPGPADPQPAPPRVVSAEKLDSEITEVIQKFEYSWRFPHKKTEEPEKTGFLAQVMGTICRWLDQIWSWAKELVETLSRWLEKLIPEPKAKTPESRNLLGDPRLWLVVLLIAAVLFAGWLLRYILLRRRSGAQKPLQEAPSIHAEPDLSSENTSADELPAARWLALARAMLDEGDPRLALRAFYFSALAHLAEHNLLTLSSSKSNRDYEREVGRRAHAFPGIISAFSENVIMLERVWYGMHGIRREALDAFLLNYKRITADEQFK